MAKVAHRIQDPQDYKVIGDHFKNKFQKSFETDNLTKTMKR